MRLLVDEIAAARAARRAEIALDPAALDQLLAAGAAARDLRAVPDAGAAARTAWLLGLHAPAGASWGRFAHALGTAARRRVRGARRRRARGPSVTSAASTSPTRPSPALADLCAHPPAARRRARALGLAGARARRRPARRCVRHRSWAWSPRRASRRPGPRDRRPHRRRRAKRSCPRRSRACARRPRHPASTACSPASASTASTRPGRCRWVRSPISLTSRASRSTASWSRPRAGAIPSALDARAFRRWRARRRRPAATAPLRAGRRRGPAAAGRSRSRAGVARPVGAAARLGDLAAAARRRRRQSSEIPARRSARRARPARTVDRDGRRIEAVVALVDVPDEAGVRAARGCASARIAGAGAVPPPRVRSRGAGLAHLRALRRRGAARRRPARRGGPGGARRARRRRDRPLVLHPLRRRAGTPAPPARSRARRQPRARRSLRRAARSASGRGARVGRGHARRERRLPPGGRALRRPRGHRRRAPHLRIRQRSRLRAAGRRARSARPRLSAATADDRRLDAIDLLVATFDALAAGLGFALRERHALARGRRDAESAALARDRRRRAARARRRLSRARAPPARGSGRAARRRRRPDAGRCGESPPTACTSPPPSASCPKPTARPPGAAAAAPLCRAARRRRPRR